MQGPYEFEEKYLGLSTDTKPTTASLGALFYETDTGTEYIYTGSTWIVSGRF